LRDMMSKILVPSTLQGDIVVDFFLIFNYIWIYFYNLQIQRKTSIL
jgi:hypothetical protein